MKYLKKYDTVQQKTQDTPPSPNVTIVTNELGVNYEGDNSLDNFKQELKTAIEGKGVTVPSGTKLDTYPALVDSISGGSIEDLLTKENLVRILINIGNTDFTLDASNNFSDTDEKYVVTFDVSSIKFYFNDLEIDTMKVSAANNTPTDNYTYNFLMIGSTIFGLKRVNFNFYIYLNNVQIGHILCSD